MKSKRKRRRRLKKKFKIILISIPIVAAVIAGIVLLFRIQTIEYKSDINQFTKAEVKKYIDYKGLESSLAFWFKDLIGKNEEMVMFEDYSVTMNSPLKVTINAIEKKLKGYIKADKIYYYIDADGYVLKQCSDKIEGIPQITGLEYKKLELYKKIQPVNEKSLSVLLKVINSSEEYDFEIKKIAVSKDAEITLFIKKIQVQLGKENNMDKKVETFNNMYDNVVKYKGVLNMKHLSADGSYTLKTTKKSKKQKK